jgi:Mg-chelatase subunit ChlD
MISGPTRYAGVIAALLIGRALPQQPTFHVGVDAIAVDVSVRKGQTPVRGLKPGDFLLLDNEVAQQVEAVTVDSVPIDVTILLDASASVGTRGVRASDDETKRIAALLRPSDRLRVVAFSTDTQELVPLQPAADDLVVPPVAAEGSTSLNDALVYTFITTHPAPDRRHLMVVFTDGYENSSLVGDAAMHAVAARADTVIHVVVPTSRVSVMAPGSGGVVSREALINLAVMSGGEPHDPSAAYRGPNGPVSIRGQLAETLLVETFRRILDDFRQSYVIYYTLRGTPRNGWHNISVKVVAAGGDKYTVRARQSYFGG